MDILEEKEDDQNCHIHSFCQLASKLPTIAMTSEIRNIFFPSYTCLAQLSWETKCQIHTVSLSEGDGPNESSKKCIKQRLTSHAKEDVCPFYLAAFKK